MELTEELRAFILPPNDEIEMFSHRTTSKEVAEKIMREGFLFSDSFQKTTDHIVNDMVYIRYWDTLRKHYGGFVVIIGINKSISNLVIKSLKSKNEVQQALSTVLAAEIDDDAEDSNYLLPIQYIKGYVRRDNGEMVSNPNFDPSFIPKDLDKNIEILNKN